MSWERIAAAYFLYLFAVALARPAFARVRRAVPGVAIVVGGLLALAHVTARTGADPGLGRGLVWPAALLIVGYWVSGLFFVRPMEAVERRLLRLDERILGRTGVLRRYELAPRLVREGVELSYLLVHLVVPAGALTLALGGAGHALDRFWAAVLLAGFTCYAVLPWIQTRPPRVLEPRLPAATASGLVRQANELVLRRASIHANTIPSGHAAVAVATALGVGAALPQAGALLLVVAAGIVFATVAGRYHYALDSLLGVAVAVAAWMLVNG